MSLPPTTIRIKRKRDDEDAPVTFLQFDEGAKRHRTGSNWVYQRREAPSAASRTANKSSSSTTDRVTSANNVKPTIHVSKPNGEPASPSKRDGGGTPRKTISPRPSLQRLRPGATEHRRFHLSKKMMMAGQGAQTATSGVTKKPRPGPAVFIERAKKQKAKQAIERQGALAKNGGAVGGQAGEVVGSGEGSGNLEPQQQERKLKKPGTTRAKSPNADGTPTRAPLPAAARQPHEDMEKIAADMNQWVMAEIGANLQDMEDEKQKEKSRFRPKPPAQRYFERNASQQQQHLQPPASADTTMTDMSDDDDGDEADWVIEEYVRIPASAMAMDLSPTEVGVLVLDGEDDDILFFGPEHDDDEDFLEDDEDENAENHYTADYPEEEVDSDDEYNRHAYYYRNKNASDDEEYDNDLYSDHDSDEMIMEGDDDDLTMARIKAYVRRAHDATSS